MMVAPATTSPTVKPMIASLWIPLPCVCAAVLEVAVASVFVPSVVDNELLEDIADGEVVADEVAVVEDTAGDNDVTDSLALSSRVRYQLVLQKPSPFCSSVVPWALTTLKTNGFVRFVSSARTSHWYQSVAKLAKDPISRVCNNLSMLLHSLTSCTEFATFPL